MDGIGGDPLSDCLLTSLPPTPAPLGIKPAHPPGQKRWREMRSLITGNGLYSTLLSHMCRNIPFMSEAFFSFFFSFLFFWVYFFFVLRKLGIRRTQLWLLLALSPAYCLPFSTKQTKAPCIPFVPRHLMAIPRVSVWRGLLRLRGGQGKAVTGSARGRCKPAHAVVVMSALCA